MIRRRKNLFLSNDNEGEHVDLSNE